MFDLDKKEDWIKAIKDNPEDIGLKRVYADWLEEMGDPDPRGEFIRVQFELDRHDLHYSDRVKLTSRTNELIAKNRNDWTLEDVGERTSPVFGVKNNSYGLVVGEYTFKHGFTEGISVDKDWRTIGQTTPLEISARHRSVYRLGCLTSLYLNSFTGNDFVQSSQQDNFKEVCTHLKQFSFIGQKPLNPDQFDSVLPVLNSMEKMIDLEINPTSNGLIQFCSTDAFRRLETLRLIGGRFSKECMAAVGKSDKRLYICLYRLQSTAYATLLSTRISSMYPGQPPNVDRLTDADLARYRIHPTISI